VRVAETLELTGRIIGGYKLEQLLGGGAMGQVYASTHRETGQRAAVKIIPSGHLPARALVERFSNDHKLLKTIVHPGLLNIFDAGKIAGVGFYLATELLEGKPLPTLIAAAPKGFAISQALHLAEGICSALTAAHDVGILHRNVRPSNVFVVKAGKRLQVKLLDFGVPGLAPLAGAHDYRAPEQIPQAPINEGADIYSTGLILFELLTGQKVSHADDPPPPPSRFRPELSAAIDGLVLEVLARFPESRPGSAKLLRDQCAQLRNDLPSVSGEVPWAARPADDEPKTEIPSVMLKGVPPSVLDETPTEIPPELLMTPPPSRKLAETTPGRPAMIAEGRPPLADPVTAVSRGDPHRNPALVDDEADVPTALKRGAPKEPVAPLAEEDPSTELRVPSPLAARQPSELPKRIAAGVLGLAALLAAVWFWRQPIKHYSAEEEPMPAQQQKSKGPAFDPGAPMTDDELAAPPSKPEKPKRR